MSLVPDTNTLQSGSSRPGVAKSPVQRPLLGQLAPCPARLPEHTPSRIPDSTIHVIAKTTFPVRDIQGLIPSPEMTIAETPELDVLLVPGGFGQQQLMNDEEVLSLIRSHFAAGRLVFSVCTGALLCGAAAVLRGRQATTHWAA